MSSTLEEWKMVADMPFDLQVLKVPLQRLEAKNMVAKNDSYIRFYGARFQDMTHTLATRIRKRSVQTCKLRCFTTLSLPSWHPEVMKAIA